MSKKDLLSEQTLSQLRYSGNSGLEILLKEIRKAAKRANARLLAIEKKNLQEQSQAYQLANFYTDEKARFSTRRQDIDSLISEYRQIRLFLNSESSTIRGIRYSNKRLKEVLDDYGIHISADIENDFYAFVRSDTFADVVEYVGEYDVLMDIVYNHLDKKISSVEDLYEEFNNFLSGTETYDRFIKRLTEKGGMSYETLRSRHAEREEKIYRRSASRTARRARKKL